MSKNMLACSQWSMMAHELTPASLYISSDVLQGPCRALTMLHGCHRPPAHALLQTSNSPFLVILAAQNRVHTARNRMTQVCAAAGGSAAAARRLERGGACHLQWPLRDPAAAVPAHPPQLQHHERLSLRDHLRQGRCQEVEVQRASGALSRGVRPGATWQSTVHAYAVPSVCASPECRTRV